MHSYAPGYILANSFLYRCVFEISQTVCSNAAAAYWVRRGTLKFQTSFVLTFVMVCQVKSKRKAARYNVQGFGGRARRHVFEPEPSRFARKI